MRWQEWLCRSVWAAEGVPLPYAPSWVDRLTDWVDLLPVPGWVFYVLVTAVLILAEAAVKWSDGSYPVGTFNSLHVMAAGGAVYCVAVIDYLDRVAGRAIAGFRPVLLGDEAEYQTWRYRLTTLPARSSLLVGLSGLLVAVLILASGVKDELMRVSLIFTSPLAVISDSAMAFGAWFVAAIMIYHSIRQLQIVSRLYATRARVDLFNPGPLYVLCGLPARTAAAWSLALTLVLAAEPEAVRFSPLMLTFIVGFVGMAVVVFVAPLLGIHQLLADEKEQISARVGQRVKALVGELHRRVDAGEMRDAEGLNDIMSSLTTEQTLLRANSRPGPGTPIRCGW